MLRIVLVALVAISGYCITGALAVKCSHCAYVNGGECQAHECEGKFCAIQVIIDERASSTLVHKSCEETTQIVEKGAACVNVTKQGVQSITCTCDVDFCTNNAAGDLEFVALTLLSTHLGVQVSAEANTNGTVDGTYEQPSLQGNPLKEIRAGPFPIEPSTTPGLTGVFETATEAVPTPANSEGSTTGLPGQTVAVLFGAVESTAASPESSGTPAAGSTPGQTGGEAATPGTPEATEASSAPAFTELAASTGTQNNAVGTEPQTTESAIGSPTGSTPTPNEGLGVTAPNGTAAAPGEALAEPAPTFAPMGGSTEPAPSGAPTGETPGGAPTEGATNAASTGSAPTETPPPAESTPSAAQPEGTSTPVAGTTPTGATPGTPGTPGNGTSSTVPSIIEPLGIIQSAPNSQTATNHGNVTGGLEELEVVVNERVKFFSAISLQRLPTYLAQDVVLTPDKQHYDVLTARMDGDMSFNQLQLDDIVESERIYLPAKPASETDVNSAPDPFNGVLIGRDLEQVNAWPSLQAIQYTFKPTVDAPTKEIIRKAFDLWQNNTCVSFTESPASDQYVLEIDSQPAPSDASSCGIATLGRWPIVKLQLWSSDASTKIGCVTVGSVAHQVGHILGLWHAQSRFDAYEFVYVMSDVNGNVDVHPQSASQSNYDVGYDFGSIMHFAEDAVRPKDPRFTQTVGQRREPSFIDYKTINLQQRCIDQCPSINCFVGGYTTPPDCTKCHCPTGFGGEHCETVEASVGDCGSTVGSVFANDDWKDLTVEFKDGSGPDHENKCFWHIWGKNGSQVELQVVNVSLHTSPVGCTDQKTGERNFIEIKIGDNDADRSFDFQRTGFRLCMPDVHDGAADRPIVSTNRLIALIAYAGQAGTFTVRYRNAGGGNPGLAAELVASGLAKPVRPGIRVSAIANNTAALLFEAGDEVVGRNATGEDRCDIRRSLVPGDRLASPCRILRSFYGRYTYVFTKKGRHKIFYNEAYFEPRILIYEARQTPILKNGVLANDKDGHLRIEDDGGATYDPFPYFLSAERQQSLGSLKLVITEDGRLVARSLNGTEVTLVCLAHFSCVRLHRRLQSVSDHSNDTRVMLQGGILYSDNRMFFATLSSRGEFAVWERAKASDALSTSTSKMTWVIGPTSKGRTGQPYRLILNRQGYPAIKDGDDEIVWRVNITATADQLPTSFGLSDQGKLVLHDAQGKELWTNGPSNEITVQQSKSKIK